MMTYIYAFLFCGFVCMVSQIILDNTKLTPGHVTSLFVVIGAFLDLAGWRNNKSGVFTNEDWYGLANGTDSNTAYKNMTDFLAKNAAEHVKNLGFDAQYLQDLANTLNSTDPNITDDQKNTAKELLQQFYQEILTLNENAEADLYNDTLAEEIYASTATSIMIL